MKLGEADWERLERDPDEEVAYLHCESVRSRRIFVSVMRSTC